jgi:phosphoglycerate dehydrogenase-like enzyme
MGVNTEPVFSDVPLGDCELDLLKSGVEPGELIRPMRLTASPLVNTIADDGLKKAVIAFGQPDVASVMTSPLLRWIHVSSAGCTRYDTPEFRQFAKKRGLRVTNSSTVYAQACAEHVFSMMLANQRKLPLALQSAMGSDDPKWSELRSKCQLLTGQKVLIFGFGAIAGRLVEMLRPFRCGITAVRRSPKGDEGIPVVTVADCSTVLKDADHVINLLPENSESTGFFNSSRFAGMKPQAAFYNIGRGRTVDQAALVAALETERVAAAWLDVTEPEPLESDHPLRKLSNCYITPHIAGGYQGELEELVRHFLENLRKFNRGEALMDPFIEG